MRKKIKKVSVAPIDPITGSIIDSTNITDKTTNTYSANVIDKFNTHSSEERRVGYEVLADGTKVPRYNRVITQDLNASNVTISVGHNNIVKVEGIITSKYANKWLIPNKPHSSSNTNAYYCDLFMSSGDIYLELGSSMYGSATVQASIRLEVEYTKTADLNNT